MGSTSTGRSCFPRCRRGWDTPDRVLLSAGPSLDACVEVEEDVRCAAGRARPDEGGGVIDRTVQLGAGADYGVALEVRPVAGDALTGLMLRDQLVNVSASSRPWTTLAPRHWRRSTAAGSRPGSPTRRTTTRP